MRQAFIRLGIAWVLLVSLPVIGGSQLLSPRVDVTTTPSTLVTGRTATFEATVRGPTASDPAATGSVELLDGDALLASAPLVAGQATLGLPTVVPPGNHFYVLRYAGDLFYRSATSAGITLNRAGDVILARCPVNPDSPRCISLEGWLGATVLPRDGIVPTGTVSLRRDGVVFQTQPLANGRADFPPAPGGASGIVAEYSGDANHAASVCAPLSDDPLANAIRIGDLVLTSEPFPAITGVTTRFTATSISGTDTLVIGTPVPDAVYTFSAGGRQIAEIADAVRGSATLMYAPSTADGSVQAVRAPAVGTADYGVGRAVAQMVSQPVPDIRLVATPFPLVAGAAATFQITVGAAAGAPVPSGIVELRDGGATGIVVGTSPLDAAAPATASATVTLPNVPPGNHFYVARYVGDALYASATSPGVTVNLGGDVILARCPPGAGPDFLQCQGQPDKMAVTVLPRGGVVPTGQVTLREGSRFVESASLISGRADFTTLASSAANPSSLIVEYSGDANYRASVSNPLNDTLRIGDIVLASEPFPVQAGVNTRFTATTISGVPVPVATYTFKADGRLIATITDSANGSASTDYTPLASDGVVTAVREPASGDINYTLSKETSLMVTSDALGGGSESGGGCFIATAAYGSYLHPHVQTLRRFRDQVLMTSGVGRAVVAAYYKYSPGLARHIERDPAARVAARVTLTPIIAVIAYPGPVCAILLLMLFIVSRGRHARRFRT
jgi:Bacterial Ig-like domain (group 3)